MRYLCSMRYLGVTSRAFLSTNLSKIVILIRSIREQAVDNPYLRFFCSVRINAREVGRGVAQNKKQAKYLAAAQALQNICPTLFLEWKAKYRNSDGSHTLA